MFTGNETLYIYLKVLDIALFALLCLSAGILNWYAIYKGNNEYRERIKDFLVSRNTLFVIVEAIGETLKTMERVHIDMSMMADSVKGRGDIEERIKALQVSIQDECRQISALKAQIGCLTDKK